jgi:hypothetical protein
MSRELLTEDPSPWADGDIPPSWINCMVKALIAQGGTQTTEHVVRRAKDGFLYNEGARRVYGDVLSWRAT